MKDIGLTFEQDTDTIISKICITCSKILTGRQKKYCSSECQYKAYKTGPTLAERICEGCKKSYKCLAIPSYSNRRFCSLQCVGKAKRKFPSRAWKRALRKDSCEICGFIPVHIGQLDLDHIDGNRLNYGESNLQTLCANCHRLKTIMNGDHARPPYNGAGSEL